MIPPLGGEGQERGRLNHTLTLKKLHVVALAQRTLQCLPKFILGELHLLPYVVLERQISASGSARPLSSNYDFAVVLKPSVDISRFAGLKTEFTNQ